MLVGVALVVKRLLPIVEETRITLEGAFAMPVPLSFEASTTALASWLGHVPRVHAHPYELHFWDAYPAFEWGRGDRHATGAEASERLRAAQAEATLVSNPARGGEACQLARLLEQRCAPVPWAPNGGGGQSSAAPSSRAEVPPTAQGGEAAGGGGVAELLSGGVLQLPPRSSPQAARWLQEHGTEKFELRVRIGIDD